MISWDFFAFDMNHKTHATGIMLKLGVVKTLFGRQT